VIGRLALLLACSCAAAAEEPKFSGGDGSSCEQAVVPVAREGATMVETERHWLQKTYGQTVDVCFDVTTVFEDTIRAIEAEEEHGYPHNPSR